MRALPVFLLLLASPALAQVTALRLEFEKPAAMPVAAQPQLVLSITRDGGLVFADKAIPADGLEQLLKTNEAIKAGRSVALLADDSVPYARLFQTLETLKKAGVERVALLKQRAAPKKP